MSVSVSACVCEKECVSVWEGEARRQKKKEKTKKKMNSSLLVASILGGEEINKKHDKIYTSDDIKQADRQRK